VTDVTVGSQVRYIGHNKTMKNGETLTRGDVGTVRHDGAPTGYQEWAVVWSGHNDYMWGVAKTDVELMVTEELSAAHLAYGTSVLPYARQRTVLSHAAERRAP